MNDYITGKGISAADVKAIRQKLKMSQAQFASFMCVSKKTVERWESSGKIIDGPVAVIAHMISMYPDIENKLRFPDSDLPLRLIYKKGSITDPTFEEYEEFLESRCFPRTRKWVDLELKKLGLPFYDPLMIIEKTGGRMVEDDFSIEVIRP